MNEENVLEIHCPFPQCATLVSPADIAAVLTTEQVTKYEELHALMLIKTNPACRYCPRVDCGHPQIGDASEPHMICEVCHYDYCFNCREEWHEGKCCAEAKATIDPKTEKWKKKHGVRPCPRCGIEIYKFSGCPKMKCRNCKYVFHWKNGTPMGDALPNGGFTAEESSILNLGVTYPLQMRWMIGEYRDEIKEQTTPEARKAKIAEAVGIGIVATVILLPIFVVAGPPVGIYRGTKKLGRGIKSITTRKGKGERV